MTLRSSKKIDSQTIREEILQILRTWKRFIHGKALLQNVKSWWNIWYIQSTFNCPQVVQFFKNYIIALTGQPCEIITHSKCVWTPVLLPIPKNSNEYVSISEMYCNIDIDTECGKILRQYQYPIKILKYFSVSISIFFSITLFITSFIKQELSI